MQDPAKLNVQGKITGVSFRNVEDGISSLPLSLPHPSSPLPPPPILPPLPSYPLFLYPVTFLLVITDCLDDYRLGGP